MDNSNHHGNAGIWNPPTDPLDDVLDILASYEDTPFAIQPIVSSKPTDAKLSIIQLKIHALAARAFTSEISILRTAQSPPTKTGASMLTPRSVNQMGGSGNIILERHKVIL